MKNEFIFYQQNLRLSRSVRYGSKNVLKLKMQRRRSIPNKNMKNEKSSSTFLDDSELDHFTLLFWRGRQRSVQIFITHVHSYCLLIKALSTLIRFQTKTELFCSVFKKICDHTYRFRIVFARPHYNAVSVLKTLLNPQCACSNELNACRFQYIAREIDAKLVASVRHFGYSRSSGLAPGRVYFDDVTVFR